MAMPSWAKGVAFINGFNLGWYWPKAGPQMTMYIPGPMLRDGENELILLEVEETGEKPTGETVRHPFGHLKLTDLGDLEVELSMLNSCIQVQLSIP